MEEIHLGKGREEMRSHSKGDPAPWAGEYLGAEAWEKGWWEAERRTCSTLGRHSTWRMLWAGWSKLEARAGQEAETSKRWYEARWGTKGTAASAHALALPSWPSIHSKLCSASYFPNCKKPRSVLFFSLSFNCSNNGTETYFYFIHLFSKSSHSIFKVAKQIIFCLYCCTETSLN